MSPVGLSARAAANRGIAVPIVALEKAKICGDNNENVASIRRFGHAILGRTEKSQVANNSRIRFELEQKIHGETGTSDQMLDTK